MDNNVNVEKTAKGSWFRRKRYGWGWFPANWKGWAATLIYIVLAVGGSRLISFLGGGGSRTFRLFAYLAVITVLFIIVARSKGERSRWQWGGEK